MRRGWTAAALLALVLAAGGCRHAQSSTGTHVSSARLRIAATVGPRLPCGRVDQVFEVAPGVVQVRGCGLRRELVLFANGTQGVPVDPVEDRAARELACAPSAVTIESPGPSVRAASGCGRRARYDLACGRSGCEWTMTAHAGAWAGLEAPTPPRFDVAWRVPEGAPLTSTFGDEITTDPSTLAVPPPPGEEATIPAPPP